MRNKEGYRAEYIYGAGRRALARHDPVRALPLLRAAVDGIAMDGAHPGRHQELADRLYWLAITLIKLGKSGLAIKALASSQKLAPRGHARALYCRVSNEYGMPRSSCPEHDDYKAFFAIQARRYLANTPGRRFSNQTEMEAVLAVIADAWLRLHKSADLGDRSCGYKLHAFRAFRIDFPALLPSSLSSAGTVMPGDFWPGASASEHERCSCGSGLPVHRCCGRVPLPWER
ncbi:MAG: hypothetical protein E4H20_12185 [Spirochaetales bacterium]|nr:MAG: hypothetical protein E4H20_12185 [Spirochaetales bacterium]